MTAPGSPSVDQRLPQTDNLRRGCCGSHSILPPAIATHPCAPNFWISFAMAHSPKSPMPGSWSQQDLCEVSLPELSKNMPREDGLNRPLDLRKTPEIRPEGRDRASVLRSNLCKNPAVSMQTVRLQGHREVSIWRILLASTREVTCCSITCPSRGCG